MERNNITRYKSYCGEKKNAEWPQADLAMEGYCTQIGIAGHDKTILQNAL